MHDLTHTIARHACELRKERRWTQAQLAKTLGLSQSRLSEIEHGKGSFTAEQLVTLLKTFNVPIDYFVPLRKEEASAGLQNALIRLGAAHLREAGGVVPTARLEDLGTVVRETLADGDPRLVTALGPVLLENADDFDRIRYRLLIQAAEQGLANRLGWLLENVVEALRRELNLHGFPRESFHRYKRAEFMLGLAVHAPKSPKGGEDEVLDAGIATRETLERVKSERSRLSKRWHLVSRIQPDDFQRALEDAHGSA